MGLCHVAQAVLELLASDRVYLCSLGWRAVTVAQSWLTSATIFWAQAIHPPQLPEYLGLQACATMPS
ncbi:hypothetical protein AAY473_012453 [Plecturocebus cupreus]